MMLITGDASMKYESNIQCFLEKFPSCVRGVNLTFAIRDT